MTTCPGTGLQTTAFYFVPAYTIIIIAEIRSNFIVTKIHL
jgi:hypothetical protein